MKDRRFLILDIFDYKNNKLCSLYDSSKDISGQAANIVVSKERNGWKELSFTLPYLCETENGTEKNFRVDYLKADYKIRALDEHSFNSSMEPIKADWYIISEPKIQHNNMKTVSVLAGHVSQLLKTKNLNLEFSDEIGNNVGTAEQLLGTILQGTGWEVGNVASFKERDGVTEKIRSLSANTKTGAFKLITMMCDLFEAKPEFNAEVHREDGSVVRTVDIMPLNPFSDPGAGQLPDVVTEDVIELAYGTNVSNVTRKLNTDNLITKLYAYGSYGDTTDGYCGINECSHKEYTFTPSRGLIPNMEYVFDIPNDAGTNYNHYYFTPTKSADSFIWSTIDPASRMYVYTSSNEACFVYDTLQGDSPATTSGSYTVEDVQNDFSAVHDFGYYKSIGLFQQEELDALATYQRTIPPYYAAAREASEKLSNTLYELARAIGNINYCKLHIDHFENDNGYIKIVLCRDEYHPLGLIYRTDYDTKDRMRFQWVTTEKLKPNGDAVNDGAAMLYVIHPANKQKNIPITWEKIYLKATDNKEDPSTLTVWKPYSQQSDFNSARDEFFVFQTNGISGFLGAYESADESIVTSLKSSLRTATMDHPVYFSQTEPTDGMGGVPDDVKNAGYGFWWKYDPYDTDRMTGEGNSNDPTQYFEAPKSNLYMWYGVRDGGQTLKGGSWVQVKLVAETPTEQSSIVGYCYNWKESVLYAAHCQTKTLQDGSTQETYYWQSVTETTEEKRISAVISTVMRSGWMRDKYYQGDYQTYSLTIPERTSLAAGNYALPIGWGGYRLFTTENAAVSGDKFSYDTTTQWLTQTVSDVDYVLDTKGYRFDNVAFNPSNVLYNATFTIGSINDEGGDLDNETLRTRSGFARVYSNVVYNCYNVPNVFKVFCYDEKRRFIGCPEIRDGSSPTEKSFTTITKVGEQSVQETTYIKIVTNLDQAAAKSIIIRTPKYNEYIIVEDIEYRLLANPIGSGEIKGILPMMKKFVELTSAAYGSGGYLDQYKAAQEEVTKIEDRFAVALGDMYRESTMQKNDYVDGDEDKLYVDALDSIEKISRPEATYSITFIDTQYANINKASDSIYGESETTKWPEIETDKAIHLIDPEIDINCWAFVDKYQKCYDQPWKTTIAINTNLTAITQHTFADVMSHIADVASSIKGKTGVYDRAAAISSTGKFYAEKLEGMINANKLKIIGGSSTWYTNEKGNMVFEAIDGSGAMTMAGGGFAIANEKDINGEWNWRTFGTGDGFTADLIVAGTIMGELIQAGSITTSHVTSDFGQVLDISSNNAIRLAVQETKDYTKEFVKETLSYEVIVSSTSDLITDQVKTTTLTATVLYGGKDVTDEFDNSQFYWLKTGYDGNTSEYVTDDNNQIIHSKSIIVKADDIAYRSIYTCELRESTNSQNDNDQEGE